MGPAVNDKINQQTTRVRYVYEHFKFSLNNDSLKCSRVSYILECSAGITDRRFGNCPRAMSGWTSYVCSLCLYDNILLWPLEKNNSLAEVVGLDRADISIENVNYLEYLDCKKI